MADGWISSNKVLILLLLAFVGTGGYFAGSLPPVELKETPETEVNVTCYTWAENGSAHANCLPRKVYAPNDVVNVTVKDCAEWTPEYSGEFQRERPCGS